jgi:N6-L-threonylcarbamoyladenine synthase
MLVLGIETSCDETSAAIVEDGTAVRSCVIATSSGTFTRSGGVIPEHAAREQIRLIHPVIDQALEEAKVGHSELDLIAVTRGPGLLGSLLVGTVTARTLALLWKKPLVGVHHTLGHLSSTWLREKKSLIPTPNPNPNPTFPLLTLSASGGHTELWLRTSYASGTLLGQTRDDAAGEAFDKGASLLGLPYPGGPSLSQAAETGDPRAFSFPLPLAQEKTLDFSFSGLKTSLKYLIRDLGLDVQPVNSQPFGSAQGGQSMVNSLAASYQHAICRHLVERIGQALERHPVHEVHVVGGVSANRSLRSILTERCGERPVRFPTELAYCTDNGAMIAAAGTFLCEELGAAACGAFETAASLPPC